MDFGEKLRLVRKERGITQEELAEQLQVSRQAISKWEAGTGYPEVDKLRTISKVLDISLDGLMDNDFNPEKKPVQQGAGYSSGRIVISTFDGSQTVNCYSVRCNHILFPSKNEPPFILQGIDRTGLFEHSVILGWYDSEECLKKEYEEILHAIETGQITYKLKYYTNVTFSGIFGNAKRNEQE